MSPSVDTLLDSIHADGMDTDMEIDFGDEKLVISLAGLPAIGKGTFVQKLMAILAAKGITTGGIDMGGILRATTGALGEEVASYQKRGAPVPTDLTFKVLNAHLDANPIDRDVLMADGMPRFADQIQPFTQVMEAQRRKIVLVTLSTGDFELDEQLVWDRWNGRRKTSGRADDQSETVMTERIAVAKEHLPKVIDHYRLQGKLYLADPRQTPDEIAQNTYERIASLISLPERNGVRTRKPDTVEV